MDYSDERPAMYAVNLTLMGLAAISVGMRLWSRKLTRQGFWWDDYLIIFALFAHTGAVSVILVSCEQGGLGRDVNVVLAEKPDALIWLLKMLYAAMFFYGASSSAVKLGVLAFYWRLFPTQFVKRGCYVLGAMCIGWTIAIEITNLNICRPIAKFWNTDLPGDCSVDFVTYFLGNSCANLVIDGLTLALPIREAMKLQISRWRKWGLIGVFLLGGIAFAACVLRIVTLGILQAQGLTNPTKQVVLSGIATGAEIYVAIIGANLPTLVPVYRKLKGGDPLKSTTSPSYDKAGASGAYAGRGPARSGSGHQLRDMNGVNGKGSSRPRLAGHDDNEAGSFETLPDEDRFGGAGYHPGVPVSGKGMQKSGGVTTSARHHSNGGDSDSSLRTDELPLRSIKVTRDIMWSEDRRSNV